MGRDVAGLRIDKKSNMVNDKSNGVGPKPSPEEDYEPSVHNANNSLSSNECNGEQDVLGVKSNNHEPEVKIFKAEGQKSTDKKLTKPNHDVEAQSTDSGVKVSPNSSDLHSPNSASKSQPNAHFLSRRQPQPSCKNYYDEEDNWSMASSTATSVRNKVTVPVAPRFTCVDRLQRRKQFYAKLEEKHKALEKEKLEYEARTKEEEQAAIKQLRKNMVVKANPVPSFYREGPPPKVELKKLPVTRAKSPNLTRRKSCGDAVKSSPEDKATCGRASRHSVGVYREGKASPVPKKASPVQKKFSSVTPKSKDPAGVRKLNGSNSSKTRPQQKQIEETTENSSEQKQIELEETRESSPFEENGKNADVAVES